jgi:hypothetical protein
MKKILLDENLPRPLAKYFTTPLEVIGSSPNSVDFHIKPSQSVQCFPARLDSDF